MWSLSLSLSPSPSPCPCAYPYPCLARAPPLYSSPASGLALTHTHASGAFQNPGICARFPQTRVYVVLLVMAVQNPGISAI